jgi:hypothetical protein
MIAIIAELLIGMPRNTDRHRPESADFVRDSESTILFFKTAGFKLFVLVIN